MKFNLQYAHLSARGSNGILSYLRRLVVCLRCSNSVFLHCS